MLLIDIILTTIIVLAVLNGLRNGFIQTFGMFIGSILGFVAAGYIVSWIQNNTDAALGLFASIVLFFIIAFIIGRLFRWLVEMLDEAYRILSVVPFLKPANKILGGVFGFFEALVAIGAFILIIHIMFPETTLAGTLSNSFIIGIIQEPLVWAVNLLFDGLINMTEVN